MIFTVWLSTLISLSHSTTTILEQDNDAIPWALTFGPSTITASHWRSSSNITIKTFAAESSYKKYIDPIMSYYGQKFQINGQGDWYIMSDGHKVLAPRLDFDAAASTKTIKKAIDTTKQELRTSLHLKTETGPNIASLYIPKFFNNSLAMAFSEATFPHGRFTKKHGFKRQGQSQQAACYAYGLHQCEIMGSPEECAEYYPVPEGLAFVIEFEKTYIHLHVLESIPDDQAFPTLRDAYDHTLGELSGPETHGTSAYPQKLHHFLKTFINNMLPVDRESIKAILGMGEASPEAITELLEIARMTIGNGAKVYDAIDPSVVAAHGAALYARDTVLDPKYKEGLSDDGKQGHEEL